MAWLLLLFAGLLEAIWVVGLKKNHDSELIWPRLVYFGVSIGSFLLMDRALKTLPVGTSYAVWTGIGALGTAFAGIVWLGESKSPLRLLCIFLVVCGLIGLKVTTPDATPTNLPDASTKKNVAGQSG